jgi:hypothetical protein
MSFHQQVNSPLASKTMARTSSPDKSADVMGKPRRGMLSAWTLDAADDPTILFTSSHARQPGDRIAVVEASEPDERLWARHQAWDM